MPTAGMSIAEEIDRMIEECSEKNHPELRLRFGEALWSFLDGVNESAHAPEGAE